MCGFSLSLSDEAHLPGPPGNEPCLELVGTHETIPCLPDSLYSLFTSVSVEGGLLFCSGGNPATAIEAVASLSIAHVSTNTHAQHVTYQCARAAIPERGLGQERRARILAALAAEVGVRVQAGSFSRGLAAGDGCLPVSSLCLFLRPSFLCYKDGSHIGSESTLMTSFSLGPPAQAPVRMRALRSPGCQASGGFPGSRAAVAVTGEAFLALTSCLALC